MDNVGNIETSTKNAIALIAETLKEDGPRWVQTAITILTTFINAVISQLPEIIKAALQIGLALLVGILQALPSIIIGIAEALPEIVDAFIEIFDSFRNG